MENSELEYIWIEAFIPVVQYLLCLYNPIIYHCPMLE